MRKSKPLITIALISACIFFSCKKETQSKEERQQEKLQRRQTNVAMAI
jgi:hypothetical protein